MQEEKLLSQLKDISNYKKPNYPIVQGILHSTLSSSEIIKEISELLREDFLKTQDIIGEKITTLVMGVNINALNG